MYMKKLLLLAGVVMLLASCAGNKNEDATDSVSKSAADSITTTTAAPAVVKKSLNGIDSLTAVQWIDNFYKSMNTNSKPTPTSYFLNKDLVTRIVKILVDEGAGKKPDGVRIYFAKKSAADTDVLLILVSTVDSTTAGGIKNRHHDYYSHSSKSALFDTIPTPTFKPTDFKIEGKRKGYDTGALLYTACPTCQDRHPSCATVNSPGAIRRRYAESMANSFGGGVFNTRAVWFPIKTFARMAAEKDFSGLRIYLSNYPDATYGHLNRTTIVMTTVDSTGTDYFYCDPEKKVMPLDKPDGDPENNGELCPANCN